MARLSFDPETPIDDSGRVREGTAKRSVPTMSTRSTLLTIGFYSKLGLSVGIYLLLSLRDFHSFLSYDAVNNRVHSREYNGDGLLKYSYNTSSFKALSPPGLQLGTLMIENTRARLMAKREQSASQLFG